MTKEKLMKEFASNLSFNMKDANTNIKELSKLSGIDERTIRYYLEGKRMPTVANLINIANSLCCYIEDFIDPHEKIV